MANRRRTEIVIMGGMEAFAELKDALSKEAVISARTPTLPTRTDLIAVDIALGLPFEEIAERYGVDVEFLEEFHRANYEVIQSLHHHAYRAHVQQRIYMSMKASMFLEHVMCGGLSGEKDVERRIRCAIALLLPMPTVVLSSTNEMTEIVRQLLKIREEENATKKSGPAAEPRVPSFEELMARLQEDADG